MPRSTPFAGERERGVVLLSIRQHRRSPHATRPFGFLPSPGDGAHPTCVTDRSTPGAWAEAGHKTIYERAHERVHEILSEYYPAYIPPDADARIRERFPIKLRPEDMRPGNGRWGK